MLVAGHTERDPGFRLAQNAIFTLGQSLNDPQCYYPPLSWFALEAEPPSGTDHRATARLPRKLAITLSSRVVADPCACRQDWIGDHAGAEIDR